MPSTFRDLHQRSNPFILANAWDAGSAKMLAGLGAQAIATSSGAHAFTLGRPDMGTITRDEALTHAQELIAAVNIPVSGDFENGFGDAPDTCAETVRLAGEIGLAGICIEDIALPETTPYDFDLAVERIHAAASAARALPNDFVLAARADGLMNGHYDLDEAIRRISAYEVAGADCVYIPALASMDDLARICAATTLPVNALVSGKFANVSRAHFAAIGVARISLGAGLARVTHRAIHDAAVDMFVQGDFGALTNTLPADQLEKMLG